MRKQFILLAAIFFAGSVLSSCKLFQPTESCPAYGKAKVEKVNVEHS